MYTFLIVGLGGFLGSIARYKISTLTMHMTAQSGFPVGTFTVNVIGCLIVGALAGALERYDGLGTEMRLFLFTGLLGGFTTFSAFGLETIYLIRRGDLGIAALYASGSVVLGIMAVWLGFKLAMVLAR